MNCVFEVRNDGRWACPVCGLVSPVSRNMPVAECGSWVKVTPRPAKTSSNRNGGPGAELHAILRDWLGVEPTADCPCRSMAAKMDRLGPDWCESTDGMAEILGVMRAEHAKRRQQGATILPWTDFGARQLVLLACRRARANASG